MATRKGVTGKKLNKSAPSEGAIGTVHGKGLPAGRRPAQQKRPAGSNQG
jgi:hypothetical protein